MTSDINNEHAKHEWLRNVINNIKASPKWDTTSLRKIADRLGKDYAHLNQQYNGKRKVSDSLIRSIEMSYGIPFNADGEALLREPQAAYSTQPIIEVRIRMQGTNIIGIDSKVVA